MSVNKYEPHVYVLPEDRANLQIANGFHLEISSFQQRKMQVLRPAGGWAHVLDRFASDHVPEMDRYTERFVVLLIDLDGDMDRLVNAKARIPARFEMRVFILGARTEPETLRHELGPYEDIGKAMAKDCREGTNNTWGHRLLRHNVGELTRLRQQVVPILFPAS